MSVYKNKNGKWTAFVRYKDWQGKSRAKKKETFKTRREALEFERDFLQKKTRDVTMGFPTFVEQYLEDVKPRIKYNTYLDKKYIIETKILPYFENKGLSEISGTDIIQWQN